MLLAGYTGEGGYLVCPLAAFNFLRISSYAVLLNGNYSASLLKTLNKKASKYESGFVSS